MYACYMVHWIRCGELVIETKRHKFDGWCLLKRAAKSYLQLGEGSMIALFIIVEMFQGKRKVIELIVFMMNANDNRNFYEKTKS